MSDNQVADDNGWIMHDGSEKQPVRTIDEAIHYQMKNGIVGQGLANQLFWPNVGAYKVPYNPREANQEWVSNSGQRTPICDMEPRYLRNALSMILCRLKTGGSMTLTTEGKVNFEPVVAPAGMNVTGYDSLAAVLQLAYNQAAIGKGAERHAQGEPFDQQVMQSGAHRFGTGALLYQAFKKSEESQRLPHDAAVRELLGAINYLAGAVIALEAKQAGRTPFPDISEFARTGQTHYNFASGVRK